MNAKTIWKLQRAAAHLVAPILRATGYRFGKAWRGNGVIDHVAANQIADGIVPFPIDEFRFE